MLDTRLMDQSAAQDHPGTTIESANTLNCIATEQVYQYLATSSHIATSKQSSALLLRRHSCPPPHARPARARAP